MSEDYITRECIIEEFLNNWFTYQELAQYLCIDLSYVEDTLDQYVKEDQKKYYKVIQHKQHIQYYYETLDEEVYILPEDQRYIDIALYMINHKKSIRQVGQALGISKTTVHEIIHQKLPSISIKHYKQVFDILMENKSFSTNNKQVIQSVLESYSYLMMGNTINEIKDIQGIGWNVVERNLTTRLKKIDKKKYIKAKEVLANQQVKPLERYHFK